MQGCARGAAQELYIWSYLYVPISPIVSPASFKNTINFNR